MSRDAIPADIKRAVLVEAGHRCAIPTCRSTTTEIAHIVPWAETQDNSFANLIALCPNCHTRYDQKKEIDRKAIQMYKQNLGVLNNRYGDMERRIFEYVAVTKERVFILGAGGDFMVANAVKDGLFVQQPTAPDTTAGLQVNGPNGFSKWFPVTFIYWVSDKGVDFVNRYASGLSIA